MAVDSLDVMNRALAKLPASPISDEDETSLEARECRRFYPVVVSNMLEGPQEFSFAKQRVILALAATNDRDDEWLYAYVLPSNCASPIRVLPDFASLGISIPVPLSGDPYAEAWASSELSGFETPYILDGDTIYSNEQYAVLEYVIDDIAGLRVSQLVIEALSCELAAKICVPIKKDSARENTLKGEAEIAWERAIADDRNRQPEYYSGYTPEAIAARHGSIC